MKNQGFQKVNYFITESLLVLFSLFSILSLVGCSLNTRNPSQMGVAGGAGGAVIGASAGAIVGSVIKNGNIGMSALLGTAIGVPVGAAASYMYTEVRNERELGKLEDRIDDNYQRIHDNDTTIEKLRRGADDDSFLIQPDSAIREEHYLGPSLGNPYR